MATINLLPEDFKTTSGIITLASKLKVFSLLAIFAYVLFLAGSGSYIFYLRTQKNDVVGRQNGYAEKIKNLEATEQRLVLLRDRVEKANKLYEQKDANNTLKTLDSIIGYASPVTVAKADFNDKTLEVTLNAPESASLVRFLATLVSDTSIANVLMENFGYSQATGYTIALKLSPK